MKPESGEASPRRRLWAAAELLVAGALVIGANVLDVIPVSETPWLVLLGWLSLRLRGLGWKTLGLRRPGNWITTIAVALAAGIALQLISEFVTEPLIERLTGQAADLSSFRPSAAYLVAVAAVSLLFGLGHYYQGAAGVVNSAFSGLFFGALYLAGGRDLWLPILAHGFSDTIGLGLIYFGLAPELRE